MRNGFQIQKSVVSALIYRELKTRVSNVKFGVFGVFIEPLGVMAIFVLIIGFLRQKDIGMDITLFLLCGIISFTLFSDIAIRSLNAIKANSALFVYRLVKPIDTVIARSLVETGLYAIVFIVIAGLIFLFKEKFIISNFPLLVLSYLS